MRGGVFSDFGFGEMGMVGGMFLDFGLRGGGSDW